MERNQVNHDHTQSHHVGARLTAVCMAVIVLAVLFALSGCADSRMFGNRIMCNMDGTGAVVVSQWGGFGFASNLSETDVRAVCQRQAVKQ